MACDEDEAFLSIADVNVQALPTARLRCAEAPGSANPPASLHWAVPRPGSPTAGMMHYAHDDKAPLTKLTARILLLQNLLSRSLEKAYELDKEFMFHQAAHGEIPEALVYARQRSEELESAFVGFCSRRNGHDGPIGIHLMKEVIQDFQRSEAEW